MILATICKSGDNIVASSSLYGGIYNLLKIIVPRLGVDVTFVKEDDPEAYRKAIDEKTRAIHIESIGNPKSSIPDFRGIANVAHDAGIPLIVDK